MDQSTPPWRVFDAPGAQGVTADRGASGDGTPSAGGSKLPLLAVAGIGAAVLIGGLAVVLAVGGVADGPASGRDGSPGGPASDGSIAAGDELIVDVAGAVVSPGVYHLEPGARVGDAIDAAGGFSARVDANRVATELNLAAPLSDGQQVRVPSRDDEVGEGQAGEGGGGGSGSGGSEQIELNSATQAELESLPGIGPVTAGKIIESRAEAPFRTVDELRERGLVGEKTFETIRALVRVG